MVWKVRIPKPFTATCARGWVEWRHLHKFIISTIMKFGDSFHQVFEEKLNIGKDQVLSAIQNPSASQSLNNDIKLYVKSFDDAKYSLLLVASQAVNGEDLFGFAYWVPTYLADSDKVPLDLLKSFVESFGCTIRVGNLETMFIEHMQVEISGKLLNPFQIVEILEHSETPCEIYLSYNESPDISANNVVDIFYTFAVNNNLYYRWLFDVELVELKVPANWLSYFKNISKSLDPFGKTRITINNPANDFELLSILPSESSSDRTSYTEKIFVPKPYIQSLERATKVVMSLKENQKIVITTKIKGEVCLFCKSNNKSQEHVFSKWLRDYFPDKQLSYHLHTAGIDEDYSEALHSGTQIKKESLYGLVTYKVCEQCNNTWLSKLEEKVKGILTNNSRTLVANIGLLNLSPNNSQILAQWLCIKALLLAERTNLFGAYPSNAFQPLYNGNIPTGFLFEVAEFNDYDFHYQITSGIENFKGSINVKRMPMAVAQEIARDFFKVTIQIGQLVFRISSLDDSKGLQRSTFVERTNVIYPLGYNLSFFTNAEADKVWCELNPKLKLRFFHVAGLQLDEV
jgi:hypothetical protein